MALFKNGIMFKFVLCFLAVHGDAADYQCSKFPYEEALLEKMVRLEFSVQKMAEGIEDTKKEVEDGLDILKTKTERLENTVNDELANLQAERKRIEDDRNEFEVKIQKVENDAAETLKKLAEENKATISTLQTSVEEGLKQTESAIGRMSADLTEFRNVTIHDIIDQNVTPAIMFRARQLQNLSPNHNQRFVFLDVLENEGNGYDESNGVFTAPYGGVYLFTVQLCSYEDFKFAFVQDGVEAQLMGLKGGSKSGCGTATYVTQVRSYGKVWVTSKRAVYSRLRLMADAYSWNVFSGILINSY